MKPCPKCKSRPKCSKQGYCRPCANAYAKENVRKHKKIEIQIPVLCSKCRENFRVPGRAWCRQCFAKYTREYVKTPQGRAAKEKTTQKYQQTLRFKLVWREQHHSRRAREVHAPGQASVEQIQARIDFYGRCCAYCENPYECVDHVIPLSRGGSNWPANLRPACRHCNSSKGRRTLFEWRYGTIAA